MKKIFFIIFLSVLLGFIFLPNLVKSDEGPQHLSELEQKIKDLVIFVQTKIVPFVGGFAIVVAGILFMFSGASPQLHNQAKDALIYIVIGLLVIWGAAEIVKAITGVTF